MLGRRGFGRMGRPGLLGMAARTAVVAGTATAVSGRVQRHQAEKAQEAYDEQQPEEAPAPAPAASPASDMDETIAQLQKLGALRDQGILTDDEFAAQKARLLGS